MTTIAPPLPQAANGDHLVSKLRNFSIDAATPLPSLPSSSNDATESQRQPVPLSTDLSSAPHIIPFQPSLNEEGKTTWVPPRKRIVSPAQLARFEESDTFRDILGFVRICNEKVVGLKLRGQLEESEVSKKKAMCQRRQVLILKLSWQPVRAILSILSSIASLVAATPPESGTASRFGNPAFRTLYDRIQSAAPGLHAQIPGLSSTIEGEGPAQELSTYFVECWGNAKRIDYGSGMELNLLCWLLCLTKLKILDLDRDGAAIVLKIFWGYIGVMRSIQSTYWLEPAGSHGVWGLDDYHFLPFLWGSGQLRDHKHLRPKSIHDPEVLADFSPDYMYFACIHFINSIKTASLRWHSPMLDDISSVRTWSKVNEGMLKMYRAEVLLKLPIAQHIFFGSILPFPSTEGDAMEEVDVEAHEDSHGHIHAAGAGNPHAPPGAEGQAAGWGDCCGIPIPSAFGAAKQEKEGGALRTPAPGLSAMGSGVRRIPFD